MWALANALEHDLQTVSLHSALQELTRERVPLDWATTQNNLGLALWRLGNLSGNYLGTYRRLLSRSASGKGTPSLTSVLSRFHFVELRPLIGSGFGDDPGDVHLCPPPDLLHFYVVLIGAGEHFIVGGDRSREVLARFGHPMQRCGVANRLKVSRRRAANIAEGTGLGRADNF